MSEATLAAAHDEQVLVRIPSADVPEELTDVARKLAYFVSDEVVSVSRPTRDAFEVLVGGGGASAGVVERDVRALLDRLLKIGRAHLNSSHSQISYAVFCLKKKKENRLEAATATGSAKSSSTC